MARRRILVTGLLLPGAILAACSGRPAAPVVQPVHVPQIRQQEPGAPGAGAEAPPAEPAAQAPAEAPAKAPDRAAAPAPVDPSPATTYPATPPVVADAAKFIGQIQEAQWDLERLQVLLPPAEASYHNKSGEEPTYREYAYDGGALRLFEGAGKESLFAVLIDTGRPGYEAFRDMKPLPGMQVELLGPYVVIIRAAEGDAPPALKAKIVNIEALEPTIGRPTFGYHLHGVGTYMYFYVPEGVQLHGSLTDAEVVGKSGADLRRSVAAMLVGDVDAFARGPKVGRTSPDGKRWAAKIAFGGYWNNWIIVRTPGQAEQRYQADYFIEDYLWLDDHRILFVESMSSAFTVIDVNARSMRPVPVSGSISEFGPAGAGRFWYKDHEGKIRDIEIR